MYFSPFFSPSRTHTFAPVDAPPPPPPTHTTPFLSAAHAMHSAPSELMPRTQHRCWRQKNKSQRSQRQRLRPGPRRSGPRRRPSCRALARGAGTRRRPPLHALSPAPTQQPLVSSWCCSTRKVAIVRTKSWTGPPWAGEVGRRSHGGRRRRAKSRCQV